ncbi:hypothetical protein [Spirosoma endophyticum]|uniref:Uncharacterized protein n=1 Tax=Spirosoma endophyticum TaxID=662367 RepID=A0A1I1SIT3_9BACT|nr:hypothetical protein [Spirosoma endophyticum]SFD46385.1 hypothetical protein SAMN05216167_105126 [Spirosoma endophyticum]
MVDIRLNGESVELLPGTTLVLEGFNPMLDFTTVRGTRVYGFTLPDTIKNRRVLGFFNSAQVSFANRKFYCEKYVNSQLIERGYVMIQDSPPGSYNLYFTQNLGEAFGDYQTTMLTDINFGSLSIPEDLSASAGLLSASVRFPMIENAGLYGNAAVTGFSGIVNNYSAEAGYDPAGRVPMLALRWLFDAFGLETGWFFKGNFFDDPDLSQLLLYNLSTLDGQAAILLQNHLPEMNFPDVLKALRQLFNLYLDFDIRRKEVTIDFVDDILKADVLLDWTAKVAPTHAKVPDLQNRLELSYNIDNNDALMKPIPDAFGTYSTPEIGNAVGGSVTPIRSAFSTLQTNPVSGLAMTSQAGISPSNKENAARSLPKLLFWNGMVDGKPVATNERNGKALVWSGPGNLVDTYWKQFERFKVNTFLIRKAVVLTPADLARFSFRNKVHIRGVNYLIGGYKAVLGADEKIIPAELELWKV